jgi:hypothetical protein
MLWPSGGSGRGARPGEGTVTDGVGFREVLVVVGLALTGLLLAAVAALTPWHATSPAGRNPVVTVEAPGGVAGTG